MGLPSSPLGGSMPMLTLLLLSYSSSSEAYKEEIVKIDSVCSFKKVIHLYGIEDALIIKDNGDFKKGSGHRELKCQFEISLLPLSSGLDLFGVIQHMSLRRDEKGNCIDYVKFSAEDDKICGKMNSHSHEVTKSFTGHRRLIQVEIFIAGKSLKPREEINFELVFTRFRKCDSDCWPLKTCGGRTYIHKNFFKDRKLNCLYRCNDENNVCHSEIPKSNGNGHKNDFNVSERTKVKIVSGLLTMFVAFIVWIFRHCGSFLCCMGYSNRRTAVEV